MSLDRRHFLTAAASAVVAPALVGADEPKLPLHAWTRDQRNPIFVPNAKYDSRGAQGPCVVAHQGRWYLFYAGIGADSVQRICLAVASPDKPSDWERLGPIVELGRKGSFDEVSQTYPCVHRVGGKWHLYYSGRSTRGGPQHFANYWGIGLAQSDDLRSWKKHAAEPVLQGDGIKQYPDNRCLVGLGNILELPAQNGRPVYRLHYTLLPGRRDPNYQKNGTWHVIEHKVCCAAQSTDGITWTDRRVLLERRRDVASEDIGVVGMHVWRTKARYRGIYTGLGTRFKTYALAEAVSADGLTWQRGSGDNVSLTLRPNSWESGMIGYPHVLVEGNVVRLFYNGAGGGSTGIGMATAPLID